MEEKAKAVHPVEVLIDTSRLAAVPFEQHLLCGRSAELLLTRLQELRDARAEVERLRGLCETSGIDPGDVGQNTDTLRAVAPVEPESSSGDHSGA